MKENDFFCNLEKWHFYIEEIEYLGMTVQENHIEMKKMKLVGIANWSTPTTVKQVRSFLGFGNFYRKFIG